MNKKYKQDKQRKIVIALIIIGIAVIGFAFYVNKIKISGKSIETLESQNNLGKTEFVLISQENLDGFLEKQEIVKSIPTGAVINLRLYNFNTGERQWENSYILTKENATKGLSENPDAVIIISSKYVPEMYDFCNTMKKAKANDDLGYDTKLSSLELAWKFKSMMKYKECFGM